MHFQVIVIFLSIFCTCEGLSSSERRTGARIASKLRGLSSGRFVDFMLILDSSGSVGSGEFRDAKEGSQSAVTLVHTGGSISRRGSRVALIEFSEPRKTGLRFRFGRYNCLSCVKSAISRLRYDKGSRTDTARALSLARSEFRSNSSRNKKIVWMYTDGRSNTGSPLSAASRLKRMGVTVCVNAIGSSVNYSEINAIASPGCVNRFSSFSSYRRVMQYAVSRARSTVRSPPRNPPRGRSGRFRGFRTHPF